MTKFKVGQTVRLSVNHWLRGREFGRIVDFDPLGNNHWLVEFEPRETGRGITLENGKQGLWLDDSQIELVS